MVREIPSSSKEKGTAFPDSEIRNPSPEPEEQQESRTPQRCRALRVSLLHDINAADIKNIELDEFIKCAEKDPQYLFDAIAGMMGRQQDRIQELEGEILAQKDAQIQEKEGHILTEDN
ncbi:hypothetical protein FQN57_002466 [Myotisia sp. PD_48]|nr:hypothetical protein FQN57_002466 [Myotisia sp. PD_48]